MAASKAAVSREALEAAIAGEQGALPSTWLALYDLEAARGESSAALCSLLSDAVARVPTPTLSAQKAHPHIVNQYMLLWVRLSTLLRREPIEVTRGHFERLGGCAGLASNAFLYSSWSHVESSHGNIEKARRCVVWRSKWMEYKNDLACCRWALIARHHP